MNIDKDFMASLSTDQLMKLAGLKSMLKDQQKKDIEGFNPNELILNSEFIKGLNGLQYSAFVNTIKPNIDVFNQALKGYKDFLENKDKDKEKEKDREKTSILGGLPRSKEDIGGFLKLTDFKKSIF